MRRNPSQCSKQMPCTDCLRLQIASMTTSTRMGTSTRLASSSSHFIKGSPGDSPCALTARRGRQALGRQRLKGTSPSCLGRISDVQGPNPEGHLHTYLVVPRHVSHPNIWCAYHTYFRQICPTGAQSRRLGRDLTARSSVLAHRTELEVPLDRRLVALPLPQWDMVDKHLVHLG